MSFLFHFWGQSFSLLWANKGKLTLYGFWRTMYGGFFTFIRYCLWPLAIAIALNFLYLVIVNHALTLYSRITYGVLGTVFCVYVYTFLVVPLIVSSVRCSVQRKDAVYFNHYQYLMGMAIIFAACYAIFPTTIFFLFSPLSLLVFLLKSEYSSFMHVIMPGFVFFCWYLCSMFFFADVSASLKHLITCMWQGLKMLVVNHPLFFVIQWPFLLLLYGLIHYVQIYEAVNAYGVLLLYYIPATCLFFVYSCLIQVLYIQLRHTQKELYDAQ